MNDREIMVNVTWRSTCVVEVPEGHDPDEIALAINNGDAPGWAWDQITSSGAEMVDWDAKGPNAG
jgi:hypothetical protein